MKQLSHQGTETQRDLISLLHNRALQQPDKQAYIVLEEGEEEEGSLTYAELDLRARAVAALLKRSGMTGQPALLLYAPGLDFITAFFGCLYAGVIAIPALPPRSERALPRLSSIVHDAKPAVVLADRRSLPQLAALTARWPGLQGLPLLTTDDLSADLAEPWQPREVHPEEPAFLQYTSGATADPRGVLVSHGNLLHNEAMIQKAFGQSAESVVVSWLPVFHDMGLIGGVLQPLYSGGTCILLSPMAVLQRPARWLRAISRYRATTSGGPNFIYDLCARKVTAAEREGLDLSCWTVAFNGAEPVRAATLERFTKAFASCGFRPEAWRPCYGLAEATLLVTVGEAAEEPRVLAVDGAALEQGRVVSVSAGLAGGESAVRLVSCGRAAADQRVVVVEAESGRVCRPGQVGEIWVSGPSVAQGYWRRPEESAETFGATLPRFKSRRFLRTGDLGFLDEGELFVTGRSRDLILLRGRNLYPQDVEATVESSHPDLRPGGGAAFGVVVEDEERLVVVQELARRAGPDLASVARVVRQAVAEAHEVRLYELVLIQPGSLPKTSSGKVQRQACRELYLRGELPVVAAFPDRSAEPAAEPEAPAPIVALAPHDRRPVLWAVLARRLARPAGVAPSALDEQQTTSSLGLDSISAVELSHALERDLGVALPLSALLGERTLGELTDQILAWILGQGEAGGAAGGKDFYRGLRGGRRGRDCRGSAFRGTAGAVVPGEPGADRRGLQHRGGGEGGDAARRGGAGAGGAGAGRPPSGPADDIPDVAWRRW